MALEAEEGERAGVHERRGERVPELVADGHHDDEQGDGHVPKRNERAARRAAASKRARRTRSRPPSAPHDARQQRSGRCARIHAGSRAGDERNEWWGPKIEIDAW